MLFAITFTVIIVTLCATIAYVFSLDESQF